MELSQLLPSPVRHRSASGKPQKAATTCQSPTIACAPPPRPRQHLVAQPSPHIPQSTVEPQAELKGHVGSLVKVHWVHRPRIILSTADDRTARVWNIPGRSKDATTVVIAPTLTLWGHDARVWDVALVGKCVRAPDLFATGCQHKCNYEMGESVGSQACK